MHQLSDYRFDLPEELIASRPLSERSGSRMLVVNRSKREFADDHFARITGHFHAGDVLVLNNTKVFPARLFGNTSTGANVEIFLIEDLGRGRWEALARPARRLKAGKSIEFGPDFAAVVEGHGGEGRVHIRFEHTGDFYPLLDRYGKTPLPPYIKRERAALDEDRERYQTIYAASRGAIAAPTAGLHFTPEILAELTGKGVEIVEITLHVGYGTFEPVRATRLEDHRVLPERYAVTPDAAEGLNSARAEKRKITAVGTTTTRTLEYLIGKFGRFEAGSGTADLTILPGYEFRAVNAILTNFHLPESSLFVMISAFGGYELIMEAYRHAVAARYRFYSYGDCMLIV